MDWDIRYFTGTGNTERAARIVAEVLSSAGSVLSSAAIVDEPAVPSESTLLLAFPVYSWAPPALVLRWLKSLPRGDASAEPRTAAVLAVDGGDGRRAAERARRALERRGWHVIASGRAGYPANWRQMISVPTGSEAAALVAAGDAQARSFAEGLAAGSGPRYLPAKASFFLDTFLPFFFPLFARRLLGKAWYADRDCNACGLCADACPVGTIIMGAGKGARPFWKGNCETCNRCVNICPQGAIVTSIGRLLAINLLPLPLAAGLALPWFAFVLPALRVAGLSGAATTPLSVVAILVLYVLAAILVAGPIDRWLIRPLQRFGPIDRSMGKTFTKGWPTYLAPGYRPGRERLMRGGKGR